MVKSVEEEELEFYKVLLRYLDCILELWIIEESLSLIIEVADLFIVFDSQDYSDSHYTIFKLLNLRFNKYGEYLQVWVLFIQCKKASLVMFIKALK